MVEVTVVEEEICESEKLYLITGVRLCGVFEV